jgi:formylmethanofuran dehydrogenase subunit E
MMSVQECIERLAPLHPRLCPRQVLGVRIGLYAADLLGLELPRRDKRVLAFVEVDGCFADGVSAATGCWLGRRTLRLVDHGKIAATLVDTLTGRAFRILPTPRCRMLADRYAPEASTRWHAQLVGYQIMPVEHLLQAERVAVTLPFDAPAAEPTPRVACQRCGEEVLNGRTLHQPHGRDETVCRACGGERYWRSVRQSAPARARRQS